MNRFLRLFGSLSLSVVTVVTLLTTAIGLGRSSALAYDSAASNGCQLNSASNKIKHVIYFQFDNLHFLRDNPNVPSDLEQMPNLLNFLKENGTLLANHHTTLISHTANDIVTSLTGVYGDRHGIAYNNSYRYFNPDGTSSSTPSFAYWTDKISDLSATATDNTYNMLSKVNVNAPAPWVPYTRAGCNVGAVGIANIDLENTRIDVAKVYGAASPEANEAKTNADRAYADFVGIAVHCAKGNTTCSSANRGVDDVLPDEPGGYTGYNALFGHKYVAPQISPNEPLKDLDGNVIKDTQSGYVGFPGFDGLTPSISLAYTAAMQEHGIPITYGYLTHAHSDVKTGKPFGPGEAEYVAQLKEFDAAFPKFFDRLKKDGITKKNTLFVFSADEGDHFSGSAPQPEGCDGINTPCTYGKKGEINTNITGLLAQQGVTTPFQVQADDAPPFFLNGKPGRDAAITRNFERAVGKLMPTNPITGKQEELAQYMADPVELKLLHMIPPDPARTPTFVTFANPGYFITNGPANCNTPCVSLNPSFNWLHGNIQPEISTTWLGMVGPGVKQIGIDHDVWSDHADIRPTMLSILGLKDDYSHSGRVIFEVLENKAISPAARAHRNLVTQLAQIQKLINAPVGELSINSLIASTRALKSNDTNDDTYTDIENKLSKIIERRDALASTIENILEKVSFDNQKLNVQQAKKLVQQGADLLEDVGHLARGEEY